MDDFDDTQMQYSGWHSTFEEKRNEMKARFDESFRPISIISIVIGTFFGVIFIVVFCFIINRVLRMHSNPVNRIRIWLPFNNTQNTTRPVATTPAMTSFTPNGNNRQYLPLNNVTADQHARPIGFDVGIDLDRSSSTAEENRSSSLNDVRMDQLAIPSTPDERMDLDRSSRTAEENRSSSLNDVRMDKLAIPSAPDERMDLDRSSINSQENRSSSLNNVTVDQLAIPSAPDERMDLDRSSINSQENRSSSLNNVSVYQYARPSALDEGIDLDGSSRSAQDNRSLPRMDDAQLLSLDKPPAYSTVDSDSLSGDTFPAVSLRVSPESSLPNYEERSKSKR